MKLLEEQGLPCSKIIDGRVFQTFGFDFPRFMAEGIAYGSLREKTSDTTLLADMSFCAYPRVLSQKNTTVKLGMKTYIVSVYIRGKGNVSIGKFCPISHGISFQMIKTFEHNYSNLSSYALSAFDWKAPKNYYMSSVWGTCSINIGNDVWIGRECILKGINPDKPLTIGDGAVIASNSLVVKNVPPYAIVGGNPAQIIKYRFPPHVIEALLRIKWWDWSLDKIHDNFQYFKDIDKFIALHDK